ncbi:MAG: PDZ domain-containing protein [Bacteroidales bacterium]|jgi:hypothetical protein|nr:PDZ domain-containing protein [Bacteroidales bacterium]
MKKLILALSFILFLCRSVGAMENIDMSIQEMIIQPPDETKIYTNNWSNDKFSLQLRLTWIGFLIRLTNNTDQPMLLIWNRSAMVDENGNSHRLIPGETKNLHTAQSIPETMIPPHTNYAGLAGVPGFGPKYYPRSITIEKYVFILDYPVEYDWLGNIRGLSSRKSKKYQDFARKYQGRNISMILCLNTEGEDEYFKFNLALDFYKSVDLAPVINADGTIDESVKISFGWDINKGIIKIINPDGVAAKAGIIEEDMILEINAKPIIEIENPRTFIENRYNDGRTVMLLVNRNGEQKMITLKKD